MARPKNKNSTMSFMNIGLDPDEDAVLEKELVRLDLTGRQLLRFLVRKWLKELKEKHN
jgi:hypothetical protein